MRTKVAIIGAGPAGMAAAFVLHRAGREVLVLEKGDQVGGLSRTVKQGEFRFDLGTHRFFTRKQRVSDFVEGLLGDELITVKRTSKIFFKDRYFDYPPSLLNALWGLGPLMSLKIAGSYLYERARPNSRPVVTLEDWMVRNFGSAMFQVFFKTYTEKVWGVPCHEIASIWASQRIQGMSLAAAIRQAVYPSSDPPTSMIDSFRYPRLGIGRICERMAEELDGRVKLGHEVTGLSRQGAAWKINARTKEQALEFEADEVISTAPVTELVEMVSAPEPVREAASRLQFRDLILVAAMFDHPPLTRESWIYAPDPDIIFGRFHEPSNFSPAMNPAGKTTIVFDLFCFRTDPLWSWPDERLVERTLADFTRLKLAGAELASRLVGFKVIRADRAYPSHLLGYQEPLGRVREYLDALPGLWTIGREGLFAYLNIDHALESGIMAAENVMGASHRLDTVIEDASYLEGADRRAEAGKQ